MDRRKLSLTSMQFFGVTLLSIGMLLFTGCQSIQEAAREGNIEHIKTLLAFGANIDGRTFLGDQGTALHRASGAGQVETVEFLLEKGADVNVRNESSQVPLCYAAGNGHAEVVKILLENGANVLGRGSGSGRGPGSKVPLKDAANNGHVEVVKILLSHGADINQKAGNGYTALNTAAASHPLKIEMIKLLLSKGAEVNTKAVYDRTPLFTAVCRRNIELVTLFLDAGAKTDIACHGRTALMAAVGNDDAKMTELLLAHGADVNAQDKHHNTPLFKTHCRKNIEIGRILLEYGADPTLGRQVPDSFIKNLRE